MKKSKKKKIIIVIFLILVIALLTLYLSTSGKGKNRVEEVKKIDNYGYILYNNSSPLYKKYFKELTNVLNEKELKEDKYADLVAKLFVIDFYSLDNKITNKNIGGLQFIHPKISDNFRLKAEDTIYKRIENNAFGKRKQELPLVSKIISSKVESKAVDALNKQDVEGYVVTITWEYDKNLGYQTKATLSLIHEEKKLYIVSIDK